MNKIMQLIKARDLVIQELNEHISELIIEQVVKPFCEAHKCSFSAGMGTYSFERNGQEIKEPKLLENLIIEAKDIYLNGEFNYEVKKCNR